jgi:hypothetical protein
VEIIKVYGRIAGTDCFGKQAPIGSSCQISEESIRNVFGNDDALLTEEAFRRAIQSSATVFRWPLKPYGIQNTSSLSKTATVNKSIETRIYMTLLEQYKLYNPRDPTGPLPTSLRPKLNDILQNNDNVDIEIIHRVYAALCKDIQSTTSTTTTTTTTTAKEGFSAKQLQNRFKNHSMDYYEFLELID